jgi:hypothetical protein
MKTTMAREAWAKVERVSDVGLVCFGVVTFLGAHSSFSRLLRLIVLIGGKGGDEDDYGKGGMGKGGKGK